MGDIASVWRKDGGDWQVRGPSLLADDGLHTAILISLFTDRLAEPSDELPGGSNLGSHRRGWWGDAYADVPGDLIGSRLWLLRREKRTVQTLRRAEEYAREALQWLLDDGIARTVTVVAEAPGTDVLALQVTVARSAEPVASYRFEAFWKGA